MIRHAGADAGVGPVGTSPAHEPDLACAVDNGAPAVRVRDHVGIDGLVIRLAGRSGDGRDLAVGVADRDLARGPHFVEQVLVGHPGEQIGRETDRPAGRGRPEAVPHAVLGRDRPRVGDAVVLDAQERVLPRPIQPQGTVHEHERVRHASEHELERVVGRGGGALRVPHDEAADVEGPAQTRPLPLLARRQLVDREAVVT